MVFLIMKILNLVNFIIDKYRPSLFGKIFSCGLYNPLKKMPK